VADKDSKKKPLGKTDSTKEEKVVTDNIDQPDEPKLPVTNANAKDKTKSIGTCKPKLTLDEQKSKLGSSNLQPFAPNITSDIDPSFFTYGEPNLFPLLIPLCSNLENNGGKKLISFIVICTYYLSRT